MKQRMTLTTLALLLPLASLAACGESDKPATTPTTSSASPTPSVDSSSKDAAALRGDWEIPAEQYVLHLEEDGAFTQDFQGITDFRTGKYSVEGEVIKLVGDDGDTDEGKIVGETLVFTLGTATRQ